MFETERIVIWSRVYKMPVLGSYIHEHNMFVPQTATPSGVEFGQWLSDLQDDYDEWMADEKRTEK